MIRLWFTRQWEHAMRRCGTVWTILLVFAVCGVAAEAARAGLARPTGMLDGSASAPTASQTPACRLEIWYAGSLEGTGLVFATFEVRDPGARCSLLEYPRIAFEVDGRHRLRVTEKHGDPAIDLPGVSALAPGQTGFFDVLFGGLVGASGRACTPASDRAVVQVTKNVRTGVALPMKPMRGRHLVDPCAGTSVVVTRIARDTR